MPVQDTNGRLNLQAIEAVVSGFHVGTPLVQTRNYSMGAERFRLLAHRLQRARAVKDIRTVLVTSGVPGEGKSTVALNLATILACNGARTLLIDADLRAPALHSMLDVRSSPGLGAVLSGEIELAHALRRIDPIGLYFLGADKGVDNPLPLLDGPTLPNVLRKASENFDWVIVDSSPINPVVDGQCVASLVDAILLVVRWGFTPKEELTNAIEALQGLPLLGMVVNRFEGPLDAYYYSYYLRSEVRPALAPAPAAIAEPEN
jgi:capsular exopolysaccharide synthesis family protein